MSRIAPIATLPLFWRLSGRRAVVIGGGPGAAWKAELLAAAGAQVHVFANHAGAEMTSLAGITLHPRAWLPADLATAALIVAEAQDRELAHAVRTARVPLNVIDTPAACDFQFGAIVNRSPLVIGISTDGGAPVLGQAIRRRVEAVLPQALGLWAAAARAFRHKARDALPGRAERRLFWERLVDAAFTRPPSPGELDALAADAARARPPEGEVIIVGAGPGDPELLTLKAVRALQSADVIVHDRLVGPRVLELGRREARRILAGKAGYGSAVAQADISALIVDLARAGERVVRLKGGDPALFARTGEELDACRAAGVTVSIVPGVTSASAAAAALGVSLTHREHAGRVQFVTAHENCGALPEKLDLAALADPAATTVVYMGGRTAPRLAQALIARGLPGATPVAIVTAASLPAETRHATTLARLAAGGPLAHDRPTIILIGRAVAVAAEHAARAAA